MSTKKILTLVLALSLVLGVGLVFNSCTDRPSTIELSKSQDWIAAHQFELAKRHYAHTGLVVAPPATATLLFAVDSLPALSCVASWNFDQILGWSAIPGVLNGFVTDTSNGQLLLRFNASIYNSSLTDTFKITDLSGVNAAGDVTDFWQAELLDVNGSHLQYAGGLTFMRFACYETRPMQCGYAPTQEFLQIAPQWADTYPADMDNQYFDMKGLSTGRYSIRFNVDPLLKYGQTQVVNVNGNWDGLTFTPQP